MSETTKLKSWYTNRSEIPTDRTTGSNELILNSTALFRCAGDIVFDSHPPFPGQVSDVQLKQFSETSNFLQYTEPLTPKNPYFFGQIRALSATSKVTIGIAGPDIEEDAHPGKWNNTVGYQSDNGRCYSSHKIEANTHGEKYRIGDTIGVIVTYFGKQMSTVIFLKNGTPVATRYLFETDHNKFLPTISLENGPIDLSVMWPPSALVVPKFDDKNMLHWMHDQNIQYDMALNTFVFKENILQDVAAVQCPQAFDRTFQHYEVIVMETNDAGESPAVGIATCSPIRPAPTCSLMKDFFRWKADGNTLKTKVGQYIGMGIHYSPDNRNSPDFDDKAQQLVLCFITLDTNTVYAKMMIQPEGGFYPLVVLSSSCWKVKVDTYRYRTIANFASFDELYQEAFSEAQDALIDDNLKRELSIHSFRKSDALLVDVPREPKMIDMSTQYCRVTLPADKMGIHNIQFQQTLTEERNFYCIEIKKLNEDSVVTLGLAEASYPLKKHTGRNTNSVGWTSRDGRMYYNGCFDGNLLGQRFEEGNTVGVELMNSKKKKKWPVVLFIKNFKPVGTRFLTVSDTRHFLPTVSICGNGYEVILDIYWQNRMSQGPRFHVNAIDQWCLPEDAEVDLDNNIVNIKEHTEQVILQCPYPLQPNKKYDYFEINLIDDFDQEVLPPGIGLSAPCFQEFSGNMSSRFRQDYLRFLAEGEAQEAVAKGQRIGWGIIIPEAEEKKDDRLVICYLCIERNIAITRVIYEPPGGFFPVILLPQGVNRVKLEHITHIHTHPLTPDIIDQLLSEAKGIIAQEIKMATDGEDPLTLEVGKAELYKVMEKSDKKEENERSNKSKLANLVLAANAIEKKRQTVRSQSCVIL